MHGDRVYSRTLPIIETDQPAHPAGKLQIEHAREQKIGADRDRYRKQGVAQRMARIEGARDEPEQDRPTRRTNPARSASSEIEKNADGHQHNRAPPAPGSSRLAGEVEAFGSAAVSVRARAPRQTAPERQPSPDRTIDGIRTGRRQRCALPSRPCRTS